MKQHAEIAGAGFSGLALAALLADRGWSVRVHERSSEVREIGAGIFLHHNGLLVLEEMGLMEKLREHGTQLERERMLDARGRVLQNRALVGESRVWSFPRLVLIRTLLRAALDRGVDLVATSLIERATPDGTLVDARGHVFRGDLVVGADGHHSRVRESLSLTERTRELATTSLRFLLSDRDLAPAPLTTEHWSGHRRVALAACGPAHSYVYMACPVADVTGSVAPVDVPSWSEHFPRLGDAFWRLHGEQTHKSRYSLVRCPSWSKGRAVLVGDAAHALAPTLGQGTNLALSNGRSLVAYVDGDVDVARALSRWEEGVRDVTDATQRWAGVYDRATRYWPRKLDLLRAGVIWTFGASSYLNAHLRQADHTPPLVPERTNGQHAVAGATGEAPAARSERTDAENTSSPGANSPPPKEQVPEKGKPE